jgi:hypothetical protein
MSLDPGFIGSSPAGVMTKFDHMITIPTGSEVASGCQHYRTKIIMFKKLLIFCFCNVSEHSLDSTYAGYIYVWITIIEKKIAIVYVSVNLQSF